MTLGKVFTKLRAADALLFSRRFIKEAGQRPDFNSMNDLPSDSAHSSKMPPTTLASRMTDVFISPSEVFDEVKASPPNHANWIGPLVAAIIVGIVYVMVVFSQPAVLQTMKDAQDKKFEHMVAKGRLTQDAADKARENLEKFFTPEVLKTVWIGITMVGNLIFLFLTAAVLWLIGRFAFRAYFNYMQSVEVVGLALMITVLGGIIKLLLDVIYGSASMSAGPVLFLKHFDPENKIHLLLAALSITSLWYVAVLAIGVSRLSRTSFWKAAAWMFGLWVVLVPGPIWLFGGQ